MLTGFIRRAELARDKSDQRPDRFAVGEKVDAKIIAVDRAARKLTLTIKGKEVEEEKQAMAEFGSSDSGASLGDILGAAIRRRNQQAQTDELTRTDPAVADHCRMSLETDLLLDRRRLKRRLFVWRSLAVLAVLARGAGGAARRAGWRSGRRASGAADGQRHHHRGPQADRGGRRSWPTTTASRR